MNETPEYRGLSKNRNFLLPHRTVQSKVIQADSLFLSCPSGSFVFHSQGYFICSRWLLKNHPFPNQQEEVIRKGIVQPFVNTYQQLTYPFCHWLVLSTCQAGGHMSRKKIQKQKKTSTRFSGRKGEWLLENMYQC